MQRRTAISAADNPLHSIVPRVVSDRRSRDLSWRPRQREPWAADARKPSAVIDNKVSLAMIAPLRDRNVRLDVLCHLDTQRSNWRFSHGTCDRNPRARHFSRRACVCDDARPARCAGRQASANGPIAACSRWSRSSASSLIAYGFASYRAAGFIVAVESAGLDAPHRGRADVAREHHGRRRLHPRQHQARAQASDAGRRQNLGRSRICAPTAISAASSCSARSWLGRSMTASRSSAAPIPALRQFRSAAAKTI